MDQNLPSVLRVGYPHFYPAVSSTCSEFPTIKATAECPNPGQLSEIIYLIAKHLKMRIEPVPLNGKQLNESIWKGFNMIKSGEIHLMSLGFQHSESREEQFSFTKPIYKVQSRLLMRRHIDVYNGIGGFLNTYQSHIWIIILFALIIQCCLAILIKRIEQKMQPGLKMSIFESIWNTISLQLMKPKKMQFDTCAGNFSSIIFSLVQCAILLGIFSSAILSNILREDSRIPIESLDSLIKRITNRENYLISTTPNNWFYQAVATYKSYPYPELRQALKQNPLRISSSSKDTLLQLQDGKAIVFLQDDDEASYEAFKYCNLIDFNRELPKMEVHLLLQKNSSLIRVFDKVIQENIVQIMRICRKYLEQKKKLQVCKEESFKPLGIYPYLATFIVSILMFVVGSIVFIIEIVYAYLLRRRKANRKTIV